MKKYKIDGLEIHTMKIRNHKFERFMNGLADLGMVIVASGFIFMAIRAIISLTLNI